MIQFSPILLWPLLAVGGALLLAGGGWLAWRGTAGARRRWRPLLLACRLLALALMLALLANPGRWRTEGEQEPPGWALLLDQSGSMAVADEEGKSRLEAATALGTRFMEASRNPRQVTARLFSDELGQPWETGRPVETAGQGTRLSRAASLLMDQAVSEGGSWTGLVVLSDGRQTEDEAAVEALAGKAKSLDVPVHVVPLGSLVDRRDIELRLPRRQVLTLPNQAVTVPVQVINTGLDPVQAVVRLTRVADGAEVSTLRLQAGTGETAHGEFVLPAGAVAGAYRAEVPVLAEDERPANNQAQFQLQVLDKKTRVFLAEGAPYWDTKFLAHLLRDQGLMDVDAVYRLQAERFYRVSTGDSPVLEETEQVFPETAAEWGRYDLIVLGKGCESFLTEARLERLRSFVRDQGGALLFSRGKPYSGTFEGLGLLEPGRWGEETGSEYQLSPTVDGEESGLFGERLPGVKSAVWPGLTPLMDVRALSDLRPFTRVLAVGDRVGGGSRAPLLVARRFGRGMVATMNGDGLWRWGFHPEKEKGEDWHRDFWLQLLQWAATYSEFQPGEDYSLRLTSGSVASGGSVRALVGYRGGQSPPPQPVIELSTPEGRKESIPAAPAGTGEDGHPRWGALLAPKGEGTHTVRLVVDGKPGPSVPLVTVPPPGEADERSADLPLLTALAESTGGKVWKAEDWRELLGVLEPERVMVPLSRALWEPWWNQAWVLGLIAFLFGAEWFARRRLGLL